MRTPILLSDLGNTLVEYFRGGGFSPVLRESIRLVMGPIFATARRYDDTLDALASVLQRWDGAGGACGA